MPDTLTEHQVRLLVHARANMAWGDYAGCSLDWACCEHCGRWCRTGELEMHHRYGRGRGGIWSCANIIGLCCACHKRVTENPAWAESLGLSVATGSKPELVGVEVWYSPSRVYFDNVGCYWKEPRIDRGGQTM